MNRRFAVTDLSISLATAGALVFLRFYIFYTILASTLIGFFTGQRRRLVSALLTQIALVLGVIVLLLSTSVGQEMLEQARFLDLQELQRSRDDLARAGAGFAVNADVSPLPGL